MEGKRTGAHNGHFHSRQPDRSWAASKVRQGRCVPLLCSSVATLGVVGTAPATRAQEGHGPIGASPEEVTNVVIGMDTSPMGKS